MQSLYYAYGYLRSLVFPSWGSEASSTISPVTNNHKIYLGGLAVANDLSLLKIHGITHIICAVIGAKLPFEDKFEYLYLPIRDNLSEDISQHFDASNKFIDSAIKSGGAVLIHCMQGCSRSATLAAAYMIYKGDGSITAEKAIESLKLYRPFIDPNENFLNQLKEYYKKTASNKPYCYGSL